MSLSKINSEIRQYLNPLHIIIADYESYSHSCKLIKELSVKSGLYLEVECTLVLSMYFVRATHSQAVEGQLRSVVDLESLMNSLSKEIISSY